MNEQASPATLVLVSKETRGQAIVKRREHLGIFSAREMEDATAEVDRRVPYASVLKAEKGIAADRIYSRLEAALDLLEERMGEEEPKDVEPDAGDEPKTVEFRLSGNFGVDVVVKGPVSDMPELESAVSRLIREMRDRSE